MQVQPYVFFNGRCEEAIEFYKHALGAKVEMFMRFKDCPDPNAKLDPKTLDKVMHASFKVGDTIILASDGQCAGETKFEGFGLALSVPDDATAKKTFSALSEGGKVNMPLTKTFFSSNFGMVADRFGIMWMVMVGH